MCGFVFMCRCATMSVLGITGGVATGKSTVAAMFANLGAPTVSADVIARRLTAPGTELAGQLIRHFGREFALNNDEGALDRVKLAQVVFENVGLRRQLEHMVHPQVIAQMQVEIDHNLEHASVVVAEIPLLFEAGLTCMVDKVLVVSCKPETQLARIMARVAGSTREAAQKRMDSQMPLCEKTGLADYVIDSDQRIESEAADVLRLYELLRRDGV